jgi:hypothetical protein
LVTQNLIISAAQAETAKDVRLTSVRDLVTLINLVVMYDDVLVLGRGSRSHFQRLDSSLMDYLRRMAFIDVSDARGRELDRVIRAARRHLATFLKEVEDDRYEEILRGAMSGTLAEYGLTMVPDTEEEISEGREWLRAVGEGKAAVRRRVKNHRAMRFLVRTFLYLGYSDHFEMPFAVDSVREPVVREVARRENALLGEKLLRTLGTSYAKYPHAGAREVRRIVSPFAAVVFKRARDRAGIVKEIQRLREELTPLRDRMRQLEQRLLWGNPEEATKAELKWKRAVKEVGRSYGEEPGYVSFGRLLSFGTQVGEIGDKPTSWKAWIAGLASLPADVVSRILARRTVAEVHSLRRELPGPLALKREVSRLFGGALG